MRFGGEGEAKVGKEAIVTCLQVPHSTQRFTSHLNSFDAPGETSS